ncbi:MAG TPA: DUF402 domain-containing protein [Acidimicrobiia bacterium]|nr:DUF402 domain-containing protein [Acidimicrobiia bacterium]
MSELSRVQVDMRKWPDRKHWQFTGLRLGEDAYGTWLFTPEGSVAQRGSEPPISLATGFVGLVPPNAWWMAEFYWNHPSYEVYVNISTPVDRDGDRMTSIDLDLDIIRRLDGTVEILDEDEFLEHSIRYAYPPELIGSARRAAERAAEALFDGDEPYGWAMREWLEAAQHSFTDPLNPC